MTKILIDHREDKKLIRELAKKKLNIDKKQLLSADVILETKRDNGSIETVGIEIKKQNDFLNSIIDKRLHNQLINLKENFSIPLLIIEGEDNMYEIRNFHPNSIRGMLTSIIIDYRVPILYTRNHRDTASIIETISKRLDKTRRPLSLLPRKKPTTTKEHQELIIETFPGVGRLLAKSLLKKFGTIKRVVNAKEEKLKKVEKIGPKKAKSIRKVLDEKYKS